MFGRNVTSPEDEAAYLTMFIIASKPEDSDDDIESWSEEFRNRFDKFTAEHPNFDSFKSIKISSKTFLKKRRGYFCIRNSGHDFSPTDSQLLLCGNQLVSSLGR